MAALKSDEYAIALHTSTPELGIAIDNYSGDRRSQIWHLGRDLASSLHQHLQAIVAPQTWNNIKLVAVAKGPGGFTGTRVGVVTARTIAQQMNIPLFGISNLAAVAAAQHYDGRDLLAVQMDARRGQLFVAIYYVDDQGLLQTYLTDTLMMQESWQETLAGLPKSHRVILADNNIANTVTNVLDLAYGDWQRGKQSQWTDVKPFYGQHPVQNT